MNSLNSPRIQTSTGVPIQAADGVYKATMLHSFFCEFELTNKAETDMPHMVNLVAQDGSTKKGFICAGCMNFFPGVIAVTKWDMDTYLKPEKTESKKEQE